MTEEVRTLMSEEIKGKLEDLNKLPIGSKEYQLGVQSISTLYDSGTKEMIADWQYTEQLAHHEEEIKLKREELMLKREELRQREKSGMIQTAANIGTSLLQLGVYGWALVTCLDYETNHVWSTQAARRLIDKIPLFRK